VHVLLIGPLPPPLGGTTVMFTQLVHELAAHPDVGVTVIDTSRGERSGRLADLLAALRVVARLPAQLGRSEVVTFHASPPGTAFFGPILLLFCRIWRRPLLVREFGGSLDVDLDALGPLPRALVKQLFSRASMLLETRALVSHFERRFPGSRCIWYPNSRPVDPGAATRSPATPDRGARRFVFMGHVKRTKGVGEILEASRHLGSRDVHIDVFGPPLDGFQLTAFEGYERVTYRGVIPPERVSETLRSYDALLLPTHHPGEGYPGVILEAYAEGLPVVTTRWRSIPEIVDDGVSGILIPPHDSEALARALAELHDDPARLRHLRAGALARAGEFSLERWTREFVRICRQARDTSGVPAGDSL
jgi:glycosyltransferase involved in cell wall biosynthesis